MGAQNTHYAGNVKRAGHISRQTFIDTYGKAAFRNPYGRKNAPVAADTLNDAVIPFFDSHGLSPLRVLTDRGSEHCGNRERHEYALCLEAENAGHTGTKAKSPRTDGICERFNRTREDGFHSAAFRRKACRSVAELQPGPGQRARRYNEELTHGGKYRYWKTPTQTFMDSMTLAGEKPIGCDETDGQPA